jgi:hypothetical protein
MSDGQAGGNRKKKGKSGMRLVLGIVAILISIFIFLSGRFFTLELPYYIATGWIYYIAGVSKAISTSAMEIYFGMFIVVVLTAGLHFFAKGVYSKVKCGPIWRRKWTLFLVIVPVIMFAAGSAVTGAIHQIYWAAKARQIVVDIKHPERPGYGRGVTH